VNASFVVPRAWRSGHLQTVRSRVLPGRFDLERYGSQRQLLVDLDDGTGDQLSVLVHRSVRPPVVDSAPRLLLLVHGLGGSAESDYVRATSHGLLQAGFNVARLDLRGVGLSRHHSRHFYHAGRTEDLRTVLTALAEQPEADNKALGSASLGIIGFSMGGNLAIKLLGEPGLPQSLAAGAAVSSPLDLVVGAEHLHKMAFGLYEKYLLTALQRDSLLPQPDGTLRVSETERIGIKNAKSIADFDDALTAKRNGWKDANEYYAVNSSRRFLERIQRPLLIVHSLDDPMIPASPYREVDWVRVEAQSPVRRLITEKGGHVGFHERGRQHRWFITQLIQFFLAEGRFD
jgi:predicted alpha/beta-fold hydrolase